MAILGRHPLIRKMKILRHLPNRHVNENSEKNCWEIYFILLRKRIVDRLQLYNKQTNSQHTHSFACAYAETDSFQFRSQIDVDYDIYLSVFLYYFRVASFCSRQEVILVSGRTHMRTHKWAQLRATRLRVTLIVLWHLFSLSLILADKHTVFEKYKNNFGILRKSREINERRRWRMKILWRRRKMCEESETQLFLSLCLACIIIIMVFRRWPNVQTEYYCDATIQSTHYWLLWILLMGFILRIIWKWNKNE